MNVAKARFILVDTNCFIRLYCSPIVPLLQQQVGDYQLLTLKGLIDEFFESPRLLKEYPWVSKEPKVSDLKNAALIVRGINARLINEQKKELRPYADSFLAKYCKDRNIVPAKRLSSRDLELLASAVVLRAIVATDEWPLGLVIRDLMQDPDDYEIELMTSLDILHLLEKNGKLARDIRIQTCDSWIRLGEKMPTDWRKQYKALFGEPAPVTQ